MQTLEDTVTAGQSTSPTQMCKDSWLRGDQYWHDPKKIEFTEALPNSPGKKVKLNVPSVGTYYPTTATAAEFDVYYSKELRDWLYAREQDRANNKCGYPSFPVGMARIGDLVIVISAQNDPAVGWPDAPDLEKMFKPINTQIMKVFSGNWGSTGEYKSLSSQTDYSAGVKYSTGIELAAGCSILFYQLEAAGNFDGFDKSVALKVKEWSQTATDPASSAIAAARIENTLVVVVPDAKVEQVDADIRQLSPKFVTSANQERFAYPRPVAN